MVKKYVQTDITDRLKEVGSLTDESLRMLKDHQVIFHSDGSDPKKCVLCRSLRRSMMRGVK